MVRVITAEKKYDCSHLIGKFLDESHYDVLIDEDCDFYVPDTSLDSNGNGEHNIAFKIRKNVFTTEEQKGAYDGLIGAAGASQNRGLAAGPRGMKLDNRDWVTEWQLDVIDAMIERTSRLDGTCSVEELIAKKDSYNNDSTRGLVWLRNKIVNKGESYEGFFDRWLEKVMQMEPAERAKEALRFSKECISNTTYANPVNSGVAGFYDRYPRIDWGRACAYNENNPELFAMSFPYLKKLDKMFSELLPERYAAQKAAANKLDPRFLIDDTVFTTLTVNRTFRTAAHLDAGDLEEGFSNLGVILPPEGKNFKGGYLVLPEYRVAINIRPGDLLLIANHTAIHGNTEILPAEDGCCPECIIRMSVVAYFRENMLNLGDWEYEQLRREFVDQRRLNNQHPLWRPGWNGISPSWASSDEFHNWLLQKPRGEEFLQKYHSKKKSASLF